MCDENAAYYEEHERAVVREWLDDVITDVVDAAPVPLSDYELQRLRTIAVNAEIMLQICQAALAAKGDNPPDWMLTDVENAQAEVDRAKRALE